MLADEYAFQIFFHVLNCIGLINPFGKFCDHLLIQISILGIESISHSTLCEWVLTYYNGRGDFGILNERFFPVDLYIFVFNNEISFSFCFIFNAAVNLLLERVIVHFKLKHFLLFFLLIFLFSFFFFLCLSHNLI